MNEPKTRGKALKTPRSIDDEIAEAEARLQALRAKQQEEKEQRERELNLKDIQALIRQEGLDAAPLDQWQAVVPKLRQWLKLEARPVQKTPETAPQTETTADVAPADA